MLQNWYLVTLDALFELWRGFLFFLPNLMVSFVIFLGGWILASAAGRVVSEVLKRVKFNEVIERGGWKEALEKAELSVNAAEFIGSMAKWVIVFAFLLATVQILGLTQFALFLSEILAFIPNIIVALLILVVAIVVSDILGKLAKASIERTKIGYSRLAGLIVHGSIWYFAVSAILLELNIFPRELVTTLFKGVVALVVISFGLAFGLGGKEIAADVLRNLRESLKK